MEFFIIVPLAAMALAAVGILLYKHFVANSIKDKGGMENPEYTDLLDGDGTYVDNEALLRLVAGTWTSGDGRYVLTFDNDSNVALMLDAETVLESVADFMYLQPGNVERTDFTLRQQTMKHGEDAFGEVVSFCYDSADMNGGMYIETKLHSGKDEIVQFEKSNA